MASVEDIAGEDIEYRRRDGKPLLARIYRPRGAAPFPALVEVHGGAWTANDRSTNAAIHRALAASGAVVMAIDFRMPPEAQYPASIQDINLAVRWLKAHAREFAVRPDRVGGLGTSSGGHQLMLSALRPRDPRYSALPVEAPPAVDAGLAFVVLCWSIVDPLARYRMVREKGIERLVNAHHAYWPSEAAMAEGNPQLILERGEAQDLPPALMLQGTSDDNVTPDMADRFAVAYRQAGGRIDLTRFEGEPHAFIAKDPASPASRRALDLITAFVRREGA
ncbi:MAG TPA: alpha/beta hydrolase [Stellaceae bacterium]|nr:alpha/beta hydrolase [Stellaceae bacterium]